MIDRRIGKIKVRRGTESQRVSMPFEEGEVIYSVDKKRIFVGDYVTLGGVPVSNRNYIVESLGFPPVLPDEVLEGDIIFDKLDSSTYITRWTGTKYELLLIGDGNCCIRLQNQIDDLYTKLKTMTGCLAEPPDTPLPPSKLTWAIQPTDVSVNLNDTITFSSSAIGSGSITYEWRRNDGLTINTPNIYQKDITITNVSISDIATYYCVASNTIDSITSRDAVLNIGSNFILSEDDNYVLSELDEFIEWTYKSTTLKITKQPISITTIYGNDVTFNIEAIGTPPITYQWRIAGINISGETNSSYTKIKPTVDINSITCKVSNPAGDVISDSVNLTINDLTDFLNAKGTTGAVDGDFSIATFNAAHGACVSPSNDIYVVDYNNNKIRKVSLTNKIVSTYAGLTGNVSSPASYVDSDIYYKARFKNPIGIAYNINNGNICVTDSGNDTIRQITPSGKVTTLVKSKDLMDSHYLTFDSNNNLFCANIGNHTIMKINSVGTMTVFVGKLGVSGYVNEKGENARLNAPHGIAIDKNDNLYVTEYNGGNIRKITPSGDVTTIFTGLKQPRGIVYHHKSNSLIVAESGKKRYLQVFLDGTYILIGTTKYTPTGLVIDNNDNLYCNEGNKIRTLKL